ncbi:hypothetical protein G5B39_00200 [Rhodobacteraceae bacterium SC52]|nr:hypothetical protein G5B39_00200 [Rhodobacteraceae bacterium SC52]
MLKTLTAAAIATALLTLPVQAKTVFTDLSSFFVGLPAAGTAYTETFETGYSAGDVVSSTGNMSIVPASTGFNFTVVTGNGSINGSNPLEDFALILQDNDTGPIATLVFTEALAYFGVFYIDAGPPTIDGTNFSTTAASGDSALFAGFHFTAADNRSVITIENVSGDGLWGLDGFVWGTLPTTTTVPVPAALPLLAGALGLLAVARRKG